MAGSTSAAVLYPGLDFALAEPPAYARHLQARELTGGREVVDGVDAGASPASAHTGASQPWPHIAAKNTGRPSSHGNHV